VSRSDTLPQAGGGAAATASGSEQPLGIVGASVYAACMADSAFSPSPVCRACLPGYYSPGGNTEAASRCRPCAPGRFAARIASPQCAPCPLDTYSPGTSATVPALGCVSCDIPGNTTTPGVPATSRADCTVCAPGYQGEPPWGCAPCPSGTFKGSVGTAPCILCVWVNRCVTVYVCAA